MAWGDYVIVPTLDHAGAPINSGEVTEKGISVGANQQGIDYFIVGVKGEFIKLAYYKGGNYYYPLVATLYNQTNPNKTYGYYFAKGLSDTRVRTISGITVYDGANDRLYGVGSIGQMSQPYLRSGIPIYEKRDAAFAAFDDGIWEAPPEQPEGKIMTIPVQWHSGLRTTPYETSFEIRVT